MSIITFDKAFVCGSVVRNIFEFDAAIVGIDHRGAVDSAVCLGGKLFANVHEGPYAGREPREVGDRGGHVEELTPARDEHDAIEALCGNLRNLLVPVLQEHRNTHNNEIKCRSQVCKHI